jgi:UDP-N-acetylmuramoyl-tripeptide--D-alanyl-D-alanine ligase
VNGRLQRKVSVNGALVIDDTYNANPDSVRAAIDVLAQAAAPRILVLGDMGEVGNDGRQYHEEIGAYARANGIEHVLTLGDLASSTASAFGAGAHHYENLKILNDALAAIVHAHATVLVKGSRFMKMERVVQHLVNQQIQEAH